MMLSMLRIYELFRYLLQRYLRIGTILTGDIVPAGFMHLPREQLEADNSVNNDDEQYQQSDMEKGYHRSQNRVQNHLQTCTNRQRHSSPPDQPTLCRETTQRTKPTRDKCIYVFISYLVRRKPASEVVAPEKLLTLSHRSLLS